MIDPEIREILRSTLEHLRTQVVYVRNLHEHLSALSEALAKENPSFDKRNLRVEMEKIRANLPQTELIAQIDALLQRLERLRPQDTPNR